MNLVKKLGNVVNNISRSLGYEVRRIAPDYYLHEYSSYDEYKKTQIRYNKEKLYNIWADQETLDLLINRIKSEYLGSNELFALCHGTRNGFEQNYIASKMRVNIIGTDISETAHNFERSIQWDFHDRNDDWVNKCDFIYTNSLDQSWKPKEALYTWLEQLKIGGLLFIEHTEAHGPGDAGEMDPFGVAPKFMPYVLCEWFGHHVAIEIITSVKSNNRCKAFLFVIKRLI